MFRNCVFRADVNTVQWMRAAVRRAVKTMAQAAVAMLPAAATITAVDWKTVAGTAVLAGGASILTSLAGLPELDELSISDTKPQPLRNNDKDPYHRSDMK